MERLHNPAQVWFDRPAAIAGTGSLSQVRNGI